jgi:hypothetical protein
MMQNSSDPHPATRSRYDGFERRAPSASSGVASGGSRGRQPARCSPRPHRCPAERRDMLASVEIDIHGCWDALALSQRLNPYPAYLVQLGPERWLVPRKRPDGAASDSRARSSRSRNACASAESRMPQSESTASHIRYGLAERVTRERRSAADGGLRAAVAPPLAVAKRVTAPGRDPLRRLRLRRRRRTPARPLPDVRRERMGGGEAARPPRGSFVTPTCRSSRATSSIRLTRASSTAS